MSSNFYLVRNKFCDDIPNEVLALNNSDFKIGFEITSGNSIGTVCGWVDNSQVCNTVNGWSKGPG